jgi:hypothetical protein
MADPATSKKDRWDKLESIAKIVAGLGAGLGAILIPLLISHYAERNRQAEVLMQEQNRSAQIYMQIMSEREKSDTDTRAKMFERLMINYLGEFKQFANRDDEASFRKQVMILDVLSLNFQEFFNARPLFEEVYRRLVTRQEAASGRARAGWEDLKAELERVARNVASRQALVLDHLGQRVNFTVPVEQTYCVRMYDAAERRSLSQEDGQRLRDRQGSCLEVGSGVVEDDLAKVSAQATLRRSIEIYVKSVNRSLGSAQLQVTPFDDVFEGGQYRHSRRAGGGFEFEVSYFDFPYMDNTKLGDGSRLAVILRKITEDVDRRDVLDLSALRFRHDFVSLRDRPAFDEMLKRLSEGARSDGSR